MRSILAATIVALLCVCALLPARAQEQPNPKTLLPDAALEAIANEVSGALAYNSVADLGGYEHDRPAAEYAGTYRESEYIVRKAREYGYTNPHLEIFSQQNKTWDGEMAELWIEEPMRKLVVSYRDIPACLATGSHSGDVTSDLIYIGRGDQESDYRSRDVKGKLLLVSGSVGAAHSLAVRKYGAAGVVSFYNGSGKPADHPDQIAWSGIDRGAAQGDLPNPPAFGIIVSHRMGMELLDLIESGKTVRAHAIVKAAEYPADMEVVTATIPGDGSSTQEIVLSGHLFEGIAKQGAMDDMSGCATILETGRAYMQLVKKGLLPAPRRTIRFLWVPEISGTNAYLSRYQDEARRMVADINMDMVGEDVTRNHNSLHLFRTPYSAPSYLNDVCQQFFEFVGDTNREKVHNRRIAYAFRWPILDPTGSRDPFYFDIEKHYGSSDHAVFLIYGIPAVIFNNWPDIGYHTSEDRPNNADPTQLKRTAFIAGSALSVLASASGFDAVRIAALTNGLAGRRLAAEVAEAINLISRSSASDFGINYREAINLVSESYRREADAIESATVLAGDDSSAAEAIKTMAADFRARRQGAADRLASLAGLVAKQLGVENGPALPTSDDIAAGKKIPVLKKALTGLRGFGGEATTGLTGFYASEARAFVDGKRSILDIRNAISAELGPIETSKVEAYFESLSKAGVVEIQIRVKPPPPPPQKKPKKGSASGV